MAEERKDERLEEELPETSVLSDEQLSENAKRNREILKRTAAIERALLLAITFAFVVALVIMGFKFF
ncbi:MAG: hypothetical protein IJ547_03845 [Clostridia bacterium]|nr:hypothetical protein [Clostridia bacterium]